MFIIDIRRSGLWRKIRNIHNYFKSLLEVFPQQTLPGESVVPRMHSFPRNYTHNLTRSHGIIPLFLVFTLRYHEITGAHTRKNTHKPTGARIHMQVCMRKRGRAGAQAHAGVHSHMLRLALSRREHASTQARVGAYARAHTHNLCTGTHALLFMKACAHTYTCLHRRAHARMFVCVGAQAHIDPRACAFARASMRTHAGMHTQALTRPQMLKHRRARTSIHTHMRRHTCTGNTHVQTHLHARKLA